ncbi:calpain-9-like [Petromyzon marinus]|uniref:calpain-9-like n=1 Tax=Petromyzon marinus TaxID=7757 RepID=UPI003F7097E9
MMAELMMMTRTGCPVSHLLVAGDCWFLAAISSLTLNERLLGRVVPMQQGFGTRHAYAGIFHFKVLGHLPLELIPLRNCSLRFRARSECRAATRSKFTASSSSLSPFQFWRYGEWVDVVVDDRLPTLKGKLAFVRSCESNEFWGALLEKAYAKVCGSYEALRSGRFTEALVDFTGGVKEHYLLGEAPPPNLWLFLKRAENAGSLMGAATHPRPHPGKPAARGDASFLGPHFAWRHEDDCSGPSPRYGWGRDFGGLRPSASFSSSSSSLSCSGVGERVPRTRPEQKTRDGLVLGHAYSITGVERVKVDGEVVELVRLRNPWGKVEWNGAWSDRHGPTDQMLRSRFPRAANLAAPNNQYQYPRHSLLSAGDVTAVLVPGSTTTTRLGILLLVGDFPAADGTERAIAGLRLYPSQRMSLEDFRRHFKRLDVCHLTPDDVQNGPRKTWTVTMYQGSWQAGHSAGGTCKETFWKNPQYLLDLHEADAEQEEGDGGDGCGGCGGGGCGGGGGGGGGCGCGGGESALCSLIVSLMQKPRDAQRNRAPWFSIGFAIYKVPAAPYFTAPVGAAVSQACGRRLSREELRAAAPVALRERFEALREVSQRLLLPPGRYVVIPCSLQPGEAADFLLRVFCCSCDSSELTDELQECGAPQEPVLRHEQHERHLLRTMWSELFQQHASTDQSIGPAELQAVLSKAASKYPATISQSFSSGTCQKIIILLNKSVSSKLASREFEILSHKFTEIHDLYRRFRLHGNAAASLQSVHRGLYKAGLPVSGDLEKHTLLRYLGGKRRIDFEDFLCCLLHIDALSGTVKAILQRPDIQPEQKEWMKRIMFF